MYKLKIRRRHLKTEINIFFMDFHALSLQSLISTFTNNLNTKCLNLTMKRSMMGNNLNSTILNNRMWPIIIALMLIFPSVIHCSYYGLHEMSPRVVFTKQGPVQGFVGPTTTGIYHLPHLSGSGGSPNFNIRQYSGRPVVEIFRGIPYASPPSGSLRYESPSPAPIRSGTDIYFANFSRPACPRASEEVLNRTSVPNNPFRTLKKTLDSTLEDCLYLDIYLPLNTVYDNVGEKHKSNGVAVLVYMNSESDDPKNPFDGSSMAAIGNVIVISVRYRTGVLGFLQPSYSEDVRSNFGLWDQLAALQWIKENIGEFGGDSNNICLMGYDIDATVSGLLALSPVSQAYNGLFHRLIMINGSPFAPNAINTQPIRTTYQLARALPCPTDERSGDLTKCLRSVPITRLITAAEKNIGSPLLTYPFSPVVDGTLVPSEISQPSPGESPLVKQMLGKYDILCGLKEGPILPKIGNFAFTNIDMDRFITAVIKLTMKMEPGSEPTSEVKRAIQKAITQDHGTSPSMRELISDFLIVQPIIDLLNTHSQTGRNSYFYVFKDYDPLDLGKNDELSYIFSSNVYKWKYTGTPAHSYNLHPFVMLINLMANFVRTGDPNIADSAERYPSPVKSWPKYTQDYGRYLEISEDVQFPSGYRKTSSTFWGTTFLSILKSFSNKSSSDTNQFEFPSFPRNYNNFNPYNPSTSYNPSSPTGADILDLNPPEDPNSPIIAGGQSTIVLIGCILLTLNFLCFMGLFYQRERLKKAEIQLRKRYIETQKQMSSPDTLQDVEISSSFAEQRPPVPAIGSNQHQQQNQGHLLQLRDNMSETETENGFGPDFLGPNYDPRTKVNRWMQMQARPQTSDYPTPTPSDINRHQHRLSRVREDENFYETAPNAPHHPHHPYGYHHHPPNIIGLSQIPSAYLTQNPHSHITSIPQPPPPPMQIRINSLQRREMPQVPRAQPEMPVQFIPQMPYQEPFKPVENIGDIPYADSRATSPSIISAPAGFLNNRSTSENAYGSTRAPGEYSNFTPSVPIAQPYRPNTGPQGYSSAKSQPENNGVSNTHVPAAVSNSCDVPTTSNPSDNKHFQHSDVKPSGTTMPPSRHSSTTPTNSLPRKKTSNSETEGPKSSSILVTPGPKRSSTLIVRDLDPQEEESEPKYVPVKTGTLKRSIAVDTNHDSSPFIEEDNSKSGKGHVRVTFKENL